MNFFGGGPPVPERYFQMKKTVIGVMGGAAEEDLS
jgi:hypothetical protein